MKYSTINLIGVLFSLSLTGCLPIGESYAYPERFLQYTRSKQVNYSGHFHPLQQANLTINQSSLAAEELIGKANGTIRKDLPLIVGSFADSENMTATTSFGRMMTQQFSTQLVNRGYRVAELLMRESIYITEKGEFLLSRKAKDLSKQYEAHAAIVGTYVVGHDTIYVNAKIVDISTNTILAAHSFNVVLDDNVKKMLERSQYIQDSKT